MPYSNRPQYGEPQQGDFQAAGYGAQIPRAPRSPAFAEQSSRGQYNQSGQYNQTGPYQPQQGPGSNRGGIPGAPHSLSPVAMASSRGAVATGPHMAMTDAAGASRPSAKAGMSILFAGAIIGGLIGAVMHARQNAADAFAHLDDNKPIAAHVDTGSSPPPMPSILPGASDKPTGDVAKKDDAKKSDDKKSDDKKEAKKDDHKKFGGGGFKSFATPKKAVVDTDTDTAKDSGKKKKGNKDDEGWTIAGADKSGGDDKAEAKSDKSDAKKSDKSESKKSDSKKSDTSDTKSEKKNSGKSDDAVNVLKAAMGATENTL